MKKTNGLKQENNIVFYCLLIIFAIVFANMCKIIFIDFNNYLHSDIVAEMKFVRTVVEDGNLFTQNWMGGNESFLSRPWYFSIPIYIMTGSLITSYKYTMLIVTILILAMFYILLKKLDIGKKARLLGIILVLGMFNLPGDFAMYTMSAYSMTILVVMISIYMYIDIFVENNKKNYKIKMLTLMLLAGYTGLWGERILLYVYLPLSIKALYEITKNILENETTYLSEHKSVMYTFLLSIINVIGVCAGKIVFRSTYTPATTHILGIDEIFNNIANSAISLTEDLGMHGAVSMMSIVGINLFLKSVLLVAIAIVIKRLIKDVKNKKSNFVMAYFSISVGVTFIYLMLTSTVPVSRYLILSRYLVAILACYVIEYLRKRTISFANIKVNVAVVMGVYMMIITFTNLLMYNPKFDVNTNEVRMEVADYLVENNFEVVFASYWESNVLEGLTDGKVEAGHFDIIGSGVQKKVWAVDKKIYSDGVNDNSKRAFIITDEEEVYLEEGDLKNKLKDTNKTKIDKYNIYDVEELKVDINVGLPDEGTNTDFPYSSNMGINNGSINDLGQLETDGKEGYALHGPYVPTKKGAYKFVLVYEVVEGEGEIGKFDIATDSGNKIYGEAELYMNKTEVVIDDIVFENEDEILEYRVYINEKCKVNIKQIIIEKKR